MASRKKKKVFEKKEILPLKEDMKEEKTLFPKVPNEMNEQSAPQLGAISEEERKKQNSYTKSIFIGMLVIIVIIALISFLVYSSKKFEYVGLEFEKIQFDKLSLYQAKIPISSITGEVIANFNLYLRNDPRSLEHIPIQDKIRLKKEVIVALDMNMEDCSDKNIAGVNLGQFLAAAGIRAFGGTKDETIALEQNLKYAHCQSLYSVIITEKSEKSQIIQEGSCYKIQVADCNDMIKATERFILGVIGHSSGYDI